MMRALRSTIHYFRKIFKVLALAYLALTLVLASCQTKIIFPAHLVQIPVRNVLEKYPQIQSHQLQSGENSKPLPPTWIIPSQSHSDSPSPAIIITHGNAEIIDHWVPIAMEFAREGYVVLLQEYPGYRGTTGKPSQKSIADVMIPAYDFLAQRPDVDPQQIHGFARSIGTGVICDLTQHRPLAKLILISPFWSLPQLAYEKLLPGFIVTSPFHNHRALAQYAHPVFLIHGNRDEIIPYQHSQNLQKVLPKPEKSKLLLTSDHHNDLIPHSWNEIKTEVFTFLASES